eukprot:CAMPEP_0204822422 /NCGR_PEP_ID=MMETSP1346-20131115/604_1 /ASSEMBLY_ACC=CAM_ASM_000771 /TAXON_ID=215587 /ORGANISM="Aplanochytrium stocchinoi, Strain GSBS06" /LENGTH=108 /DNA_ID=CAMNT_0051948619 /DNA_START=175 /DNA_END=498 /DNA_ORIENTATION=+
MAEAIRDKLKKEQFVLVDSDFLRKLKENGEVRVEAEYNTCMTVTGDPNLITVFQFVKDLVSINEIAESDVFLVEEEEVDSKQKIWRAIEKVYINAFLADRMGSYDDLW